MFRKNSKQSAQPAPDGPVEPTKIYEVPVSDRVEIKPKEEVKIVPAIPRKTMPAMPRLDEPHSAQACQRIYRASGWANNLAVMEISNIRTMNRNPAVARYKVEMLEYLVNKIGV